MTRLRLAGLAALLVLALPLRSAAAGYGIGITSTPKQLELAQGAAAVLRITSPEAPVLSCNVGLVDEPQAVAPGTYEARYVPPRQTYPQVAIIVATTARGSGWLALPLAGTGEVSVPTDASGTARVTIGNRTFGPARAGPDGRASIRIVVPPGVRVARSGSRKLNLPTPEVSHLFLTALPGDASTLEESGLVLLRAFVVTPEGKPRRGAQVELEATAGRLSTPREVSPGVLEARWTLPRGAGGSATAEARIPEEKASVARVTVPRGAAKPGRIRVELDRPAIAAGEGSLDFAAIVEDAAGNPIDDVAPRVTTSAGTFLGWTRGAPGRWTGHVAVPERLGAERTLVITATAGGLSGQREVKLLPGPTAELAVRVLGSAADPRTPAALAVATTDRFGNATDDAPPVASARIGTLSGPVRDGAGSYRFDYRAPVEPAAPRDEVVIRAAGLSRNAWIPLGRPHGARALVLGPKAGVAVGTGKLLSPEAGLELGLWAPSPTSVGLVLEGRWFSYGRKEALAAGARTLAVSTDATFLALEGTLAFRRPVSRAVLWAGAGGGAVSASTKAAAAGQPALSARSWVPSAHVSTSVGLPLGPGIPFAELRLGWQREPRASPLTGSLLTVTFNLGYRFDVL